MNTLALSAELAAAYRAVNAGFARLPQAVQDSISIAYDGLDKEIDASIIAGDRDRAMDAIASWRSYWLRRFEEAAR